MKTVFLWQLVNAGAPADFRDWCLKAGIGRVVVKVADGAYAVNLGQKGQAPDGPLMALKLVLAAAGIELAGYQYTYGADPVAEGKRAAERINTLGLARFVIDAEGEWEAVTDPPTRARQYLQALAADRKCACLVGLSSFRFTKYHEKFPWAAFAAGIDFHMPQVYWVGAHNAGEQLRQSVDQMKAVRALPIIPIGAAYHEGTFTPTVSEMKDFDDTAHLLGLSEVAWWAVDDHGLQEHADWYDFLAGTHWGTPPVPPVAAAPAPTLPALPSDHELVMRLVAAHPAVFPELAAHPAVKVYLPQVAS
jgi:hypothetical protein